jgi:hypothetical protein
VIAQGPRDQLLWRGCTHHLAYRFVRCPASFTTPLSRCIIICNCQATLDGPYIFSSNVPVLDNTAWGFLDLGSGQGCRSRTKYPVKPQLLPCILSGSLQFVCGTSESLMWHGERCRDWLPYHEASCQSTYWDNNPSAHASKPLRVDIQQEICSARHKNSGSGVHEMMDASRCLTPPWDADSC